MTIENTIEPPFRFLRPSESRALDEQRALSNPHLAEALAKEKRDGHRIAVIARTVALGLIAVLLPILNTRWDVLYYEVILLVFIAIGWLQLRMARVGKSRTELALIFADLLLMTFISVTSNPFLTEEIPTALVFRFDNFIYFFVFLAVGTLAYSWRTVFAIGTWTAGLWLLGVLSVYWFGHTVPELTANAEQAFAGFAIVLSQLDPNGIQPSVRIQEIVVFVIVAAILALKGWRSNQLLIRQADMSAQRANLSRYFPPNMVDILASTNRDAGAVRNQDVAVLFADIVGFTKIAEQNPPAQVMTLLRGFHAIIERAIFENGGTLDKYLGDGVMATFGTPEAGPDDAVNALKAAKQILRDTGNLADGDAALSLPGYTVSVGVHFGPVIIGDIGPSRRLEFAVVGDTVNVAARLESATRQLGCRCTVSQGLVAQLERSATGAGDVLAGFEKRPGVHLRGRQVPIDVWVA